MQRVGRGMEDSWDEGESGSNAQADGTVGPDLGTHGDLIATIAHHGNLSS